MTATHEFAALLRAIADDPADHVRQLAFGDWLDENGEGERAELCRLHVELEKTLDGFSRAKVGNIDMYCDPDDRDNQAWKHKVLALDARARELESRLSAWPCPEVRDPKADTVWGGRVRSVPHVNCPVCGGSGDVMVERLSTGVGKQFHIDWQAGYPRYLTLPRLVDAVVEVTRGDGVSVCFPTPRLLTLCGDTPWGVAIEAVMAGDREPYHNAAGCHLWTRVGGATEGLHPTSEIPGPVFDLLADDIDILNRSTWRTYRTLALARLALGKALAAFGRKAAAGRAGVVE